MCARLPTVSCIYVDYIYVCSQLLDKTMDLQLAKCKFQLQSFGQNQPLLTPGTCIYAHGYTFLLKFIIPQQFIDQNIIVTRSGKINHVYRRIGILFWLTLQLHSCTIQYYIIVHHNQVYLHHEFIIMHTRCTFFKTLVLEILYSYIAICMYVHGNKSQSMTVLTYTYIWWCFQEVNDYSLMYVALLSTKIAFD